MLSLGAPGEDALHAPKRMNEVLDVSAKQSCIEIGEESIAKI